MASIIGWMWHVEPVLPCSRAEGPGLELTGVPPPGVPVDPGR